MADDVLRQGVQGISDLISEYGLVNVDFADVKAIMEGRGIAHMGVGHGSGEDKIDQAVKMAVNSPLLETSISGAKSILLYVAGGYDMGMLDISKIASKIQDEAAPDANIIFGATVDEDSNDRITVTLIATDFGSQGDFISDEDLDKLSSHGKAVQTADGLEGYEMDMSDIMSTEPLSTENGKSSVFDVPDFLK